MGKKKAKDDKSELVVKNKDAFIRMNFLYQAATMLAGPDKTEEHKLSMFYAANMKRIGKRLVLRISPAVKRTICKYCSSPLIPAVSARVRLSASHDRRLVVTCKYCNRLKRLKLKPEKEAAQEAAVVAAPEKDKDSSAAAADSAAVSG